jgi:hypothetical protein
VTASVGQTVISANGQRSRNNNFTIDGTDNNDISVTIATTPVIPEAVAQFQVQTNAYNAEFGRNSGAQLNIITRSGTNDLHGDVWDYYRGATLNAMDNREKFAGRTKPARFNRNQSGFALAGPLLKEKTFFFLLGQADRQRSAGTLGAVINVPTPAGFAALRGAPLREGQSGASRQAALDALGFLSGIYSQSPVFQNVRTTLVNGVPIEIGSIQVGRSQPNNTWNWLGRLDHRLGPNDNVTGRWIYNKSLTTNNASNTNFGPLFAGNTDTKDSNLAVSETHIFSSAVLNEARFSWIRRNLQFPENDPKSPTATITGFFTIGGSANFPQGRVQNSFQLEDVLTLHRERHVIKMGADVRYIKLDNLSAFDSKGTFTFAGLQDFMNNLVNFQQALQTSSFLANEWQLFPFVQDDFRVNPELTLNLGLRYEFHTVPLGLFGATDPQSLSAMVPGPVKADKNNFEPRVGFNWSPRSGSKLLGDGKTVFRGGYGRAHDLVFYNIEVVNASNFPRIVVLERRQVLDVFPNLVQGSATPTFDPLATYVNTPENAQLPESDLFSASMQREFGRDVVVELGYTGSRSRHGISQGQANPAVLTAAQAALVASTQNTLSIPNAQARRVNPAVGSRVLINTISKGQYDAGFISVQKRFSHGWQMGASYTLSRLMSDGDESLALAFTAGSPQIPQDFNDLNAEWSRSAFDRPHRFVVNWIWEIPLFKNSSNDFLRKVVGGWQISGVTQAQSGQPFTILTGVDSNGNGAGGDRPNLVPGCSPTPDPDTHNFRTFNPNNCFVVPRGTNGLPIANSLGNGSLGRNTYRAAGLWNSDLSLAKNFRVTGDHRLVLRADFFNVFNQDDYQVPVVNMTNPSFGQNTQNWGNRSITLSAKYTF